MSYVSRVGMSSTSINSFGVYLQNVKNLRVCGIRSWYEDESGAYRSAQSEDDTLLEHLKSISSDK